MLTVQQKTKVAHYMGWPAYSGTVIERALDNLATYPDREALVVGELVRADSAQSQIDQMVTTTARAVEVGSIKLRGAYQLGILRSVARQAVVAMAAAIGVAPMRDVFCSSFNGGKEGLFPQ